MDRHAPTIAAAEHRAPSRRQAFAVAAAALAAFALAPAARAQDPGPRLGTYRIVQVPLTSGTVVGLLVLQSGGVYEIREATGAPRGTGTYRYDAAQKRVLWLTGINYELGRGGSFSAEEGGKVHRIMFGPRTYAINGD